MEGVLPRTPSNRPRADAVGALIALCLLGAPLMSLFPGGIWAVYRSLPVDNATLGVLLLAPVAVGAIFVMFGLASSLLRVAEVNHYTFCAALVAGVSLSLPVFIVVLAPFPYEHPAFTAVLAALVCGSALGACAVPYPLPRRWRYPGVAPAVVVTAALFLLLPWLSERAVSNATHSHAQKRVEKFEGSIALLDHPDWELAEAHRVHHGLRLGYEGVEEEAEGALVHVLTWVEDDFRRYCDFPDVRCEEVEEASSDRPPGQSGGQMLEVHRPGDGVVEIRTLLPDGTVASVRADREDVEDGTVDPVRKAELLRTEAPGERDALVDQLSD